MSRVNGHNLQIKFFLHITQVYFQHKNGFCLFLKFSCSIFHALHIMSVSLAHALFGDRYIEYKLIEYIKLYFHQVLTKKTWPFEGKHFFARCGVPSTHTGCRKWCAGKGHNTRQTVGRAVGGQPLPTFWCLKKELPVWYMRSSSIAKNLRRQDCWQTLQRYGPATIQYGFRWPTILHVKVLPVFRKLIRGKKKSKIAQVRWYSNFVRIRGIHGPWKKKYAW